MILPKVILESQDTLVSSFKGPQDVFFSFSSEGYLKGGAHIQRGQEDVFTMHQIESHRSFKFWGHHMMRRIIPYIRVSRVRPIWGVPIFHFRKKVMGLTFHAFFGERDFVINVNGIPNMPDISSHFTKTVRDHRKLTLDAMTSLCIYVI